LISTALSTLVGAARDRVWRALTDPAEIVRWDEDAVELLDAAGEYPLTGREVRWRYRLGSVVTVLRERPVELVPGERLRSELASSLLRMEQVYTVADDPTDPARTRLSLRLSVANAVPTVGGSLDRFAVRRLAAQLVDRRLRAAQKWCENPPDAQVVVKA
jgi:hypothetical protein